MSLSRIFVFLFTVCFFSANAEATQTRFYECKAGEAMSTIKAGKLKIIEGGYDLIIDGNLGTPTPGYSYALTKNKVDDTSHHFDLALTAPEGTAITMIGSIQIHEEYHYETHDDFPQYITININKSFNWGPEEITCDLSNKK